MFNKGIFTISIDTEMAWGTFDRPGHEKFEEAYRQSRNIIRRLLDLFETFDISATWAIVGHLFLERCAREGGIAHPDIIRPKYSWFEKDWLSCDPASNLINKPTWYGKDIVEDILKASPPQEIGSHSFSHLIFSDPGCSREAAESDITKCIQLARQYGIRLESFVFPRNTVGHLDLLSKHGIKAYRKHHYLEEIKNQPPFITRFKELFRDMIPTTPFVYDVEFDQQNQIAAIPASMLFRYAFGPSRFILPHVRTIKTIKGIRRALRERKIFHLWFHPFNFAWKSEQMFDEFVKILRYASYRKKEGLLDILPLCDITKRYDMEAQPSLTRVDRSIPVRSQC